MRNKPYRNFELRILAPRVREEGRMSVFELNSRYMRFYNGFFHKAQFFSGEDESITEVLHEDLYSKDFTIDIKIS